MTDFVDLEPAARRVADLAAAVPDDLLAAPTPCEGMPVSGLLSHLLMLSGAFAGAARKAPDPGPPPPEPPPLPQDWRRALPAELDALVAAWRSAQALTGTTAVGGLEVPAPVVAAIALDELVLHGWDLARATGQPWQPDPADCAHTLSFLRATVQPEFRGDGLPFGPEVPVGDDAPALDRLVAFTGRHPDWSPAMA